MTYVVKIYVYSHKQRFVLPCSGPMGLSRRVTCHAGQVAVDAVDDRALFRAQGVRGRRLAEQRGERIEHRVLLRLHALPTRRWDGRLDGCRRDRRGRRIGTCGRERNLSDGRGRKAGKQRYKCQFAARSPLIQCHYVLCLRAPRYLYRRIWAGCGDFAAPRAFRRSPA